MSALDHDAWSGARSAPTHDGVVIVDLAGLALPTMSSEAASLAHASHAPVVFCVDRFQLVSLGPEGVRAAFVRGDAGSALVCGDVDERTAALVRTDIALFASVGDALLARAFAEDGYGQGWSTEHLVPADRARSGPVSPFRGVDVLSHTANAEGTTLGGDLVDLFPSDRRAWWAVVGDVSGRGIGAGAVAIGARDLLHGCAAEGMAPEQALEVLHHDLLRGTPSHCALALARIRSGRGRLVVTLWLAGAPRPLIAVAGAVGPVGATGVPLGLLDELHAPSVTFGLRPGATLVLHSDGLATHRRAADLDLAAVAGRSHEQGPAALADALEGELERRRPLHDDASYLLVHATGDAAVGP